MKKDSFDNVFILGNPSQCIYVLESLFQFNLQEKNNLFIITSFHAGYVKQIIELLDIKADKNIICLPLLVRFLWKLSLVSRIISYLIAKYFFILVLKRTFVQERVFIGNIEDSWMQFVGSILKIKSIIALDDGNATLNTFEKLRKLDSNDFISYRSDLILNIINLHPLKIKLKNIQFFTIYHDVNNVSPLINIFPNYLAYLIEINKNKTLDNTVIYIIGSPFIKLKMLSSSDYFALLKRIVNENSNLKVKYIKHRAEENFQIASLEVLTLDVPIEIFLSNSQLLPHKIITFYSSAAITLTKIYNSNIKIENIQVVDHSFAMISYFKKLESHAFVNKSQIIN